MLRNRAVFAVGACALLVLSLASPTHAAPKANQLGPEVALAVPKDGYVGRLEVAPLHGPVGTRVTVSGDKLPANQEFQLVWRTVKGSWRVADAQYHGREYEPVAYEIAKVRSDADGSPVMGPQTLEG
jgi:hypothetical protein